MSLSPPRAIFLRAWAPLLVLAGSFCPATATPPGPSQGDGDGIKARLLLVQRDYEERLNAEKTKVLERFDHLIEEATGAGELDEVKVLQAQKRAFLEHGSVPDYAGIVRTARSFRQARDRERRQLIEAYDAAIREYTRAQKIQEAEDVRTERDRRVLEFTDDQRSAAIDPRGEPIDFLAGRSKAMAAVWVDEIGVWHLRFAPGAAWRRFTGTITLRGGTWVMPVVPLSAARSGKDDQGDFTTAASFRYEFRTPKNGIEGLDFQVAGPQAELHFEIQADGEPLSGSAVAIGRSAQDAPGVPFVLRNVVPSASSARQGRRAG